VTVEAGNHAEAMQATEGQHKHKPENSCEAEYLCGGKDALGLHHQFVLRALLLL